MLVDGEGELMMYDDDLSQVGLRSRFRFLKRILVAVFVRLIPPKEGI